VPLPDGVQPWARAVCKARATSVGRIGFESRPSQFPGWGWLVPTTSIVPVPAAASTANVNGVQPLPWL
jgi:hypothetical protein